jgi:hypothetical protein
MTGHRGFRVPTGLSQLELLLSGWARYGLARRYHLSWATLS